MLPQHQAAVSDLCALSVPKNVRTHLLLAGCVGDQDLIAGIPRQCRRHTWQAPPIPRWRPWHPSPVLWHESRESSTKGGGGLAPSGADSGSGSRKEAEASRRQARDTRARVGRNQAQPAASDAAGTAFSGWRCLLLAPEAAARASMQGSSTVFQP